MLGLISLASSMSLCVYVLLPKKGFVFSLNARKLYEELFEYRDDAAETQRRLIYWLDAFRAHNQERINDLGQYFFAAAVALMLQLALWTWTLIDTIS